MVLFFPNGDYVSSRPTGVQLPAQDEWNADSILEFARHVVIVPDANFKDALYPKAQARMPELPFFDDDDPAKIPLYLDDEHLGHQSWVKGPFATIEEAKETWSKLCPHAHRRRWDGPHSEGCSKAAREIKENAYTVKCTMVIKAMAEIYPGVVVREVPDTLVHPTT
ncbi:hypothetical protein V5O48_014012 [Marasmius crinis-equi]|uniref:Uncharacterized protein n=1 Tax=Marasmius crinis-equi TaxID=585013 RepID=A0ABR3EYH7_9AGAR